MAKNLTQHKGIIENIVTTVQINSQNTSQKQLFLRLHEDISSKSLVGITKPAQKIL